MQTILHFTEEPRKLTTQSEAIIYFMKEMDLEMLDAFLDNGISYQDMEKSLFLSKLQEVFMQFKSSGDSKLEAHAGKCMGCNKGCNGFSFVGNYSKNYINMIVDVKAGRVKDLYQCFNFANTIGSIVKMEAVEILPWCKNDAPF